MSVYNKEGRQKNRLLGDINFRHMDTVRVFGNHSTFSKNSRANHILIRDKLKGPDAFLRKVQKINSQCKKIKKNASAFSKKFNKFLGSLVFYEFIGARTFFNFITANLHNSRCSFSVLLKATQILKKRIFASYKMLRKGIEILILSFNYFKLSIS